MKRHGRGKRSPSSSSTVPWPPWEGPNDDRSFRPGFEITASVADPDFASRVERMFLDDFGEAREMQPGDSTGRSRRFPLGIRLARLTLSVL